MKDLTYGKYSGSIEVSLEDKCLYGRILFINDKILYEGQTIEELETAFKEAVDEYLAHCKEIGKPADKPYSGTFNVRIDKELHRKAAKEARKLNMSLNELVADAIDVFIEDVGVLKVEHMHNHTHNIKITDEKLLSTGVIGTDDAPGVWWEDYGIAAH